MPNKDERVKATAKIGQHSTAGRITVTYRDARGTTKNALVISEGGSSGLKLQLLDTGTIIDNVAKATTLKGTNVYFSRATV